MKKIFVLFVLIAFLLAACTGAEPVSSEEGAAGGGAATPPAEEVAAEAPTEIAEPPQKATAAYAADELVSECTLVSALPEPPQEYAELFAVAQNDWVVGPEDAAVTLIEYGDFQ